MSTQDVTTAEPAKSADIAGGRLSPAIVLLFAVACGLSVANIYSAQPLLDTMAQDLGITPAAIGIVVTLTQVGLAFGLMLIVPLGDLWDRRKLIVGQIMLSSVALVVVGTAPNAVVLFCAMALVGLLAVVIQVIVAFAATSASPASADGPSAPSKAASCRASCSRALPRAHSPISADGAWST